MKMFVSNMSRPSSITSQITLGINGPLIIGEIDIVRSLSQNSFHPIFTKFGEDVCRRTVLAKFNNQPNRSWDF